MKKLKKIDLIRDWVKEQPYGSRLTSKQICEGVMKAYPDEFQDRGRAANLICKMKARGQLYQPLSAADKVPTPPAKPVGKSLTKNQIRSMFDVKTIVMHGLQSLPYSEEGVIYEDCDLLRKLELMGKSGYRSVLQSPDTAPYRGRAGGKTYWAHPTTIHELKQEGVLL